MEIPEQLQQVAEDVRSGRRRWAKVRTLVGWFGAFRRRRRIVKSIRDALNEVGLRTKPDFEQEFFDNRVAFYLIDELESEDSDQEPLEFDDGEATEDDGGTADVNLNETDEEESEQLSPSESVRLRIVDEPTYQVSHLPAARKEVVSVAPDKSITEAVTLMLYHDFDQLPVMTGLRNVKGMIGWKSIGRANARARNCTNVSDCMESAHEINLNDSIFDAVRLVQRNECVLIKDHTNAVCGIVTLYDIATTFNDLAEPFMLIGEIENLIRNLIAANFTLDNIRSVWRDGDKEINDVSDMTFGQYVRLLENNDNWSKMPLDIDRTFFINKLAEVREARNDVMHFEPEGVEPEKLRVLRVFARFLHKFE